MVVICSGVFQSTLPVWGATYRAHDAKPQRGYFNPRSPCGERPRRASYASFWGYFNPRSPCGERRECVVCALTERNFNPRSPCGERLRCFPPPHRGSNFNPRSPCGERRGVDPDDGEVEEFQSTLPVWGATANVGVNKPRSAISIHAPRVGSDSTAAPICSAMARNFNPRSPCGERRGQD